MGAAAAHVPQGLQRSRGRGRGARHPASLLRPCRIQSGARRRCGPLANARLRPVRSGRPGPVGLGSEWSLLTNSFKPYPACRWMHTALEAFATLVSKHALTPDEIEKVAIHTSAAMARDFMDYEPATMVDAQFSLPSALAAIAHDIRPAARWYEPETLSPNRPASFGRRIVAIVDPAIDDTMSGPARRPAGRVSTRSRGRSIFQRSSPIRGEAQNGRCRRQRSRPSFGERRGPVLGMDHARHLMDRLKNIKAEPVVSAVLEFAAASKFSDQAS